MPKREVCPNRVTRRAVTRAHRSLNLKGRVFVDKNDVLKQIDYKSSLPVKIKRHIEFLKKIKGC